MTVTHVETGSALAIREDQTGWTPAQRAALEQLGVKGASEGDQAVFFHQCQRTGLDPFARQIYMIGREQSENINGRWEKVVKQTIQTGIDGFRLIARRASDAAREPFGYADTLWCGRDGRWVDVWLEAEPPAAAKVTVYRAGQPFPAIALYSEYVGLKRDGTPTRMWAEKGALMLAKCAEALALRKAFPQDLSGLYTADEMARADSTNPPVEAVQPVTYPSPSTSLADAMAADVDAETGEVLEADPLRTPQQARELGRLLKALDLTNPAEALALMGGWIGRELASTKDLTVAECDTVLGALRELEREAEALAAADDPANYDGPLIPDQPHTSESE